MHYAYNGFVMLVILYLSAYLHKINSKTSKKARNKAFPVYFRFVSGQNLGPDLAKNNNGSISKRIGHILPI